MPEFTYCGGEYGGCRAQEKVLSYRGDDATARDVAGGFILAALNGRPGRSRLRTLPPLSNGVRRIGWSVVRT